MRQWYESLELPETAEPPRAWLDSDAPRLALDGAWRFRFAGRADGPLDFTAPAWIWCVTCASS